MEIMKSGLIGEWMLDRSENFDEVLIEMGVSYLVRKIITTVRATLVISADEEEVRILLKNPFRNEEIRFRLGEEFEERREGEMFRVKFTWDNNRLKLQARPVNPNSKKRPFIIYREIVGKELLVTYQCRDVVCRRYLRRIK